MTTEAIALIIYSVGFLAFTIIIGRLLRQHGQVFLNHTFSHQPQVAASVDFLLILGSYILCSGLLLWNVGLGWDASPSVPPPTTSIVKGIQGGALRLGISVFVVGIFHGMNILVLSILNRNARTERQPAA